MRIRDLRSTESSAFDALSGRFIHVHRWKVVPAPQFAE
jgi:hypothetical protein